MFIGHFALGFGAKRICPKVSLGTIFLTVQFADLLWPTLLLLGLEQVRIVPGLTRVTPLDFVSYPFSHSLIAILGWSLLFALVFGAARRDFRVALVLGLGVLSHWLLDLLTHRPDLPLIPGGHLRVGLGLWNSLIGTLAVESMLFVTGTWIYQRSTTAKDKIGKYGLWTLVGFLSLIYLGNLFGPLPPSESAIAWAGQAQWLLILWGYWVDRHREPRQG